MKTTRLEPLVREFMCLDNLCRPIWSVKTTRLEPLVRELCRSIWLVKTTRVEPLVREFMSASLVKENYEIRTTGWRIYVGLSG